ncbi:TetR family transcriptional regulator [Hoyosella sp. YIM 151337]|uniref:TetR/AcrR family transcriptional regulator n=1 Tax=Hoyosella sp. YIM 151337 TaxID=2992742 RepID=UPI0022368F8E|nr:TetR/AcrR family transcriptional regulator [Hoyosella sp. YIM 151337]MCW4352125.1 TetR family transcriptional regulator [Hoyosella sp. YIM 151337]
MNTPDSLSIPEPSGAPEELLPRRRPAQERSRRKFEAILNASRDLLVEVGFESFTCEEVANRAGVPIGTLYQFFANKYVIVCELDRHDLVGVQRELAAFQTMVPTLQWPIILNRFLDHLADLWLNDPSRRAVWLAVQSTPATRATAAIYERALAQQVSELLQPLFPSADSAYRQKIAEVLVHIAYSMLNFAVRDGQNHPEAVSELKRLLGSYLLQTERDLRKRKRT